jgi:tetratricopeptide (TPR) repeat protein
MKQMMLCGLCGLLFVVGCGPSFEQRREQGIGAFQVGNLDQARDQLRRVLHERPNDARALYYLGRVNYAQGRLPQAIYYFQSAIDADPALRDARVWLERAQAEAGEMGETLQFIPS